MREPSQSKALEHLNKPRGVQWEVQRCGIASQLCKYSWSPRAIEVVVLSFLPLSLSPFPAFPPTLYSLYRTEYQEEERYSRLGELCRVEHGRTLTSWSRIEKQTSNIFKT